MHAEGVPEKGSSYFSADKLVERLSGQQLAFNAAKADAVSIALAEAVHGDRVAVFEELAHLRRKETLAL